MAHKLLTDIEVQGEGLFNGNLTLGTAATYSKLVFDTSGFDTGEIEVGSFQAMSIDAQDGVFSLMSNSSSQNHAITGAMGGYVTLNHNGNKKLQTASTGINITGALYVSGDARVVGAFRDTGDSPGTSGQVLSSTATGTSWIDPNTLVSAASKLVVIACKNTSGSTINKGTPVYQTGTVGATDVIEVAPADALISTGKQPAIGLLQTTLNNNGLGNVVITGELLNFTTDPIDGLTPTTGQKVFLKSGGGLTLTKPTGVGNGIQNLGLIGKVSGGNAGSITVSSIMRTNDVPNLTTGKIWVGDGNTTESTVVHLDETNGRMGIGATNPGYPLEVNGIIKTSTSFLGTAAIIQKVTALNTNGIQFTNNGGSEKMRITDAGNVGIGTTTPSVALQVGGEIDASGGDGYRIETKPFANWASDLLTLGDWDGEGYETRFMGSNSSEVMRVTDTKVGIGLTSPTAKLDVYDSSTAINARSTQSVGLKVQGGANGQDIAQFKNQLGSITNVIDTNGYFGIGESNPDVDLHIKNISVPKIKLETTQSQYATPGQIEAWNGATNTLHGYLTWATNPGITGARLAFQNAGNTSWLEVGSNYIRSTIAGSVKSHINATGLGINNTNPQEDLDVTGTIKGDEYKGYLPAFQHGGFYHSSSGSSSTIYWIPTNYISETTSSQYYNNWIAPYSGRVKKIMMRYASGTTPTATSVTFRKSINGSFDLSTYPAMISGAATTSMTVAKVFGSTDITFNEGDAVRIGFTTNGGTRLLYGFAYTIVLEYDKD